MIRHNRKCCPRRIILKPIFSDARSYGWSFISRVWCHILLNVMGTNSGVSWTGIESSLLGRTGTHTILLRRLHIPPRVHSNRLYIMWVVAARHVRRLLMMMQLVILNLMMGVVYMWWCIA